MNNQRQLQIVAATALLFGAATSKAAAIPDPGDYTALPAGTDLVLAYVQNVKADKLYANGDKVPLPKDLGLNVNVGIFRYVHYGQVNNTATAFQLIVPTAQQKVDLTGVKSSGLGDVLIGGTVWPIADRENGEYLGITSLVTAPTGADNNQGFAVSDNRWALELSLGYSKKLTSKWTMDLVAQTEFYKDRRDNNASKDGLLRGIGHLRYNLSDATYLATSLRYTTGAKETLNGATLADRKDDTNLMFTWATFLTPQVQIMAQYGQDLKVQSGPKTQAIRLRALYAF